VSKQRIEEQLGEKVNLFAYPNGAKGDFSPETKRILKDLGFLCALVMVPGANDSHSDRYELRRISVSDNDSLAAFVAGLSGFKAFLRRLVPEPSPSARPFLPDSRRLYTQF